MTQEEAIKLAFKLVRTGETHRHYKRVVELAADYYTFITAEDVARLLIQFVKREDKDAFAQRVALTTATTPALAGSLMKPFYKVSRNDKVKKRFDFKDPGKNDLVKGMIAGFYGSKRKKNRGLDYWFKTRFTELSFTDPNSWVVTEWATPAPDQPAEPHPYELTAAEAVNFEIVNEEVKWLFAKTGVSYTVVLPGSEIGAASQEEVRTIKDGFKYTLYEQDYTIVLEQMDKVTETLDGRELAANQTWVKVGDIEYLQSVYTPKVGYVTAFRVGYLEDTVTKGYTFVSPIHVALAYFRKALKSGSEQDLTQSLHVFPQKIQYVEKCPGTKEQACREGFDANGRQCAVCHGKGYAIHTSAQDAILVPMPQDKEDMVDLNGMLVYKTPPVELLKFMDEYVKGLKIEAHLAVFNSEVFVRPELTVAKTATEVNDNMESVYDTLEPFTEAISEKYIELVNTFAHIAAVPNPEDMDNIHQYPGDLKLKTTSILLNELKLVNDSGAPSFMRDLIGTDLADIMYVGDELGARKQAVKRYFFPFNGKTPDEIATLMSSQYVSEYTKVLYANFEAILGDIEAERPEFWLISARRKQAELVEAKVAEYILELTPAPAAINFGADVPGAGGQGGGTGGQGQQGGGNPGEDDNGDAATVEVTT